MLIVHYSLCKVFLIPHSSFPIIYVTLLHQLLLYHMSLYLFHLDVQCIMIKIYIYILSELEKFQMLYS